MMRLIVGANSFAHNALNRRMNSPLSSRPTAGLSFIGVGLRNWIVVWRDDDDASEIAEDKALRGFEEGEIIVARRHFPWPAFSQKERIPNKCR